MENIRNEKWNELFQNQKSKSEVDNLTLRPDQISSYIFIFDCDTNTILYVNPSFEFLTGHSTNAFDINFLIEMIHPEDLNYFLECEDKNLQFTNKLSFSEHFKYTFSYTYRIQTIDGNYIRIMQECQALEVNQSGHLTKTLVIHKRVEDRTEKNSNDLRIFDKSQGIYIDTENRYNLSKRELEILNLIKIGMNSQQVSEKLNISKNTILTHRKNILNKTSSKSFIELVKKLSYSHYE